MKIIDIIIGNRYEQEEWVQNTKNKVTYRHLHSLLTFRADILLKTVFVSSSSSKHDDEAHVTLRLYVCVKILALFYFVASTLWEKCTCRVVRSVQYVKTIVKCRPTPFVRQSKKVNWLVCKYLTWIHHNLYLFMKERIMTGKANLDIGASHTRPNKSLWFPAFHSLLWCNTRINSQQTEPLACCWLFFSQSML